MITKYKNAILSPVIKAGTSLGKGVGGTVVFPGGRTPHVLVRGVFIQIMPKVFFWLCI